MSNDLSLPHCIGEYEQCVTCDGVDREKVVEEPCAWRNRCSAFKLHLAKESDVVTNHIQYVPRGTSYVAKAIHGIDKFSAQCDKLISKYKIVDGLQIGTVEKVEIKSSWQKKISKVAKKNAKKRKASLLFLFDHFKQHLIENLEGYKFTPPNGAIRPGRFYTIDRRVPSRYLSIYCKKPNAIGAPVCLIRFKPRDTEFDIELPIGPLEYDGIGADIMKRIHPEQCDDGRFKSVCRRMDKEGVAIVAQVIARLVKRGTIKLPKST